MSDNLAQSITLVFGSEGGFVNNRFDNGGPTKYGITAATLGAWRHLGRPATVQEVQGLTLEEATQILDKQYAQPVCYSQLPAGIDYCMFDESVNSGPVRAIEDLQTCLGVASDGHLGIITMQAVGRITNRAAFIQKLCAQRMGFLRHLPSWAHFGTGWTNRVRSVQANALKMIA